MSLNYLLTISNTLGGLIFHLGFSKISEFSIYLDDSQTPLILTREDDYEPYLSYCVNYIIDDATFDNITYRKIIRILTPSTLNRHIKKQLY